VLGGCRRESNREEFAFAHRRQETLKDHLAAVNKDLATARERLTHYEAQLGRRN